VTPDTALAAAARLMLEKKIGCLVVLENEKIVGVLTESDFVKLHAG
jgi:CBS domain-containing protein